MTSTAITAPSSPPANLVDVAHLAERATEYAAAGRSLATQRAYRGDWARFQAWCGSRGLQALPATPAVVGIYLTGLAESGKRVATIERALTSICEGHRAAGRPSPRATEPVRQVMRGIRRALGVAQVQKRPISIPELRAMSNVLPESLGGVRDRALLVLGFAGALRRSELVALDVEDLEFVEEGIRVRIRRSKTDQERLGEAVAIPFGSCTATCPVRAMQAWLQESGVVEGAIFRAVNKAGRIATRRRSGDGRLRPRDVGRIVKKAGSRIGLDPSRLGGHSLRAGLATEAAKAGKSERAIMAQGRWSSAAMARRYIRTTTLFDDNAAAGIGL